MTELYDNLFGKLIEPELRELIESRNYKELREFLSELDPIDIAESIQVLTRDEQAIVFRMLPHDTAADVFEYLPILEQEELIHSLSREQVARLLNEMEPDDRTALLEALPGTVVKRLLELLDPEEHQIATELLSYPEESIGRRATPEYVAVKENWTVAQALEHIRKTGEDKETINVVYVIDGKEKLIDDIRLRQLIFADPNSRVSDLMDRQFVALNALDDQEAAIEAMSYYDRIALPVTDPDGTLVGIVTHDDIMDVAQEETTEDIHRLGGMEALDDPYMDTSILTMVQKRVGWLAILLISGMVTSKMLHFFETKLDNLPILLVFVPLILGSGGNAGNQAATLVIRAMALQEVELVDWLKVLMRELLSGLMLGAALGGLSFLVLQFWGIESELSSVSMILFVVAISLCGAVVFGTLCGSMLPFILRSAGLDPALCSNPFVSTLSDIAGVMVYFSIAQFLLQSAVT